MVIGVSAEVSRFMIEKLRIPSTKVNTIVNGVDLNKLAYLNPEEKRVIRHEWGIGDEKPVFAMHSRLMHVPVMRTRTAGFEDQKYCYLISTDAPKDIVQIINDIWCNRIKSTEDVFKKHICLLLRILPSKK